LLHRVGVGQDRIRLVLNKVSGDSAVSPAEVEEQLGVEIAARLVRDDAACLRADTHGHLLERAAPRSRLTHQLSTLWQTLHQPSTVVPLPPVAGLWHRRTS
jgi:Flp pilus assembly CpaE family ATPase